MRIYRAFMFAVLVLLFSSSAKAQAPQALVYRPGDVIRVSVTFDGPDASKIIGGSMTVQLRDSLDATQFGFQAGFGSESKKTGPGTLELFYRVPDNLGSGEYNLAQIRATLEIAHDSRIDFVYNPPADFSALKFKIENPNTVKKPTIKNVTVLPKP